MSTTTTTTTTTPAAAVLRTETRLFRREPGSLFWILVFPTGLLCILGAIPGFRLDKAGLGGFSVVDLFVPVSVLVSMTLAAVQAMPPVLLAYREAGVLRRLRTTPVQPATLLGAQALLHAGAVVLSSALVVSVGRLAFGTPLPGSWPGYALAYLLALAAVFSIGSLITALSPNTRIGSAVSTVVVFPLLFTAGVWLPVQAMPHLLRDIVDLTPLGGASEAMTEAMAGHFPAGSHLLVTALWVVVVGAVSVRTFRWE
ncbi:ABC-2 type transporter [Nostocoides japonicum T1-X7]|uniref:Transport permease protein n=1 Tax=Nostocoides japonicum T1-X7 TaxID=1194083 RepID=A0A077M4I6_9MICO|nr:ABC transporter permease [Tetrasphaera japonica]CCH80017.1 ABC-2 type transporter [Tetrasphaera japonica T1-X7]